VADEQNRSGTQAADQTAAQTGAVAQSGTNDSAETNGNRKFAVIGVVLLLALAAAFFYWRSTFVEDTDDAQVDGNLYQISSRISG